MRPTKWSDVKCLWWNLMDPTWLTILSMYSVKIFSLHSIACRVTQVPLQLPNQFFSLTSADWGAHCNYLKESAHVSRSNETRLGNWLKNWRRSMSNQPSINLSRAIHIMSASVTFFSYEPLLSTPISAWNIAWKKPGFLGVPLLTQQCDNPVDCTRFSLIKFLIQAGL